MPLSLRHRDDPFEPLTPLPGLAVRIERAYRVMARLQGRPEKEMRTRMAEGHVAWVAALSGADAAWGWVATRRAHIGELDLGFDVPKGERYLWNFVTRPEHRGLGIYPRLLDAIVRDDVEARRFWIIHAPENHASGKGIERAGFRPVAELSFDPEGRAALAGSRAGAPARLLPVPVAEKELAPCWRCARAGRDWMTACRSMCTCDYQKSDSVCGDTLGSDGQVQRSPP